MTWVDDWHLLGSRRRKFTNLYVTGFDPDDFDGPVSIDEVGADCVQFLVGNHDRPLGNRFVFATPRWPTRSSSGVPPLVVLVGGRVVWPRLTFSILFPTGVFGQIRIRKRMKNGDEMATKQHTTMPAMVLYLNARAMAVINEPTARTPSSPPVTPQPEVCENAKSANRINEIAHRSSTASTTTRSR